MSTAPDSVTNAFTVDVEDWFCVRNLRGVIRPGTWGERESRVESSTLRVLDLLDAADVHGTFFVLGWVAEHHPDLVREIDRRGHEVGCHSHAHEMVSEQTPAAFEADLARALDTIRALVDQPVIGYRAPSFSITSAQAWAFPILAGNGIRYDSSVFPFGGHPDYGIADAPLGIHETGAGVLEFPMTCVPVAGRRVPVGGGGYFRHYPYALTRLLLRRHNAAGRPFAFYVHPWELDPDQPRVSPGRGPGALLRRQRHYHGLATTEGRLERLLAEFAFTTMADLLDIGDVAGAGAALQA